MSTEQQIAWSATEVAPEIPLTMEPEPTTGVALTLARLRLWGPRSVFAFLDQGLTSAVGLIVNLLLARWLLAETYGAFAVTFAAFVFVAGFHNVLLLEPMTVLGPSRHLDNLRPYLRTQIRLHVILVGGLSAVTVTSGLAMASLVPNSPLDAALIGAGFALPFLLLLWLVRRMCYLFRSPTLAAIASGSYLLIVAMGLLVLHRFSRLDPFHVFLLMGAGSGFASGLLLWRLGLLSGWWEAEPGLSWRVVLRENWLYGRWLMGSTVLYSVSNQIQIFLAAAVLGMGSAGILRAMQLPSLIATQVVTGTGPLMLAAFSRDFGRGLTQRIRRRATLVSVALGSGVLCFALFLGVFSTAAEHLLFNGRYGNYALLMPLLALIPTANGFAQGFSMALRASHRAHFDLIASGIATPVGILSAVLLTRWWGLSGTALSMVLSYTAIAIVTVVYFRQSSWTRQQAHSPEVVLTEFRGKEICGKV